MRDYKALDFNYSLHHEFPIYPPRNGSVARRYSSQSKPEQ